MDEFIYWLLLSFFISFVAIKLRQLKSDFKQREEIKQLLIGINKNLSSISQALSGRRVAK